MRKFISILMLIMLVFVHVGFLGIYAIQQHQAKERMTQKISLGHFETNVISIDSLDVANVLQWIEPNKEFSLNGQVYDVVKMENINGRIKIKCISDTDEQTILNKEKQSTEQQSQNQSSSSFFKIFVAEPIAVDNTDLLFPTSPIIYNLYCMPQIAYLHAEILAPPPQFVA